MIVAHFRTLLTTCCLLVLTAPVHAGLIYTNGSIGMGQNSGGGFSQANLNDIVADDFNLSTADTIRSVRFWGTHWNTGSIPADDNFVAFVFDDNAGLPGNLVAQSTLSLFSRIDTGFDHNGLNGANILEYTMNVDSPITIADSSTYWFAVQSTTSQTNTSFTWQETFPATGVSQRSNDDGGTWNPATDVAFDLFSTAVPEPSSLSMLGLCAVFLLYRRGSNRAF